MPSIQSTLKQNRILGNHEILEWKIIIKKMLKLTKNEKLSSKRTKTHFALKIDICSNIL